jgi:hypothetical protein
MNDQDISMMGEEHLSKIVREKNKDNEMRFKGLSIVIEFLKGCQQLDFSAFSFKP